MIWNIMYELSRSSVSGQCYECIKSSYAPADRADLQPRTVVADSLQLKRQPAVKSSTRVLGVFRSLQTF